MCNSLFSVDEGLLSIISTAYAQLVKMLITLEPHGSLGSNLAYFYKPLACKMVTRVFQAIFGHLRPFSENAHNF